jgi:hypothetical protein
MAKIIPFPGTRQFVPLTSRRFEATCRHCGNNKTFLIRPLVFPLAVIEKTAAGTYSIEDMFYRQNGTINEELVCCAKCGCLEVFLQFLDGDETNDRTE